MRVLCITTMAFTCSTNAIHEIQYYLKRIPRLTRHKWNIIEPAYEILVPIIWAISEGSDESVHPRRLVRAFATRIHKVLKWMQAQITFRFLAPLASCACGFKERCAHAYDRPNGWSHVSPMNYDLCVWVKFLSHVSPMNFELPCKIQVLITCVAHGLWAFSREISSNCMCWPLAITFLGIF